MPFCRKCGRRLPEYSENCPECKTSTTGPIIKIKKTPALHPVEASILEKQSKAPIPAKPAARSVKVVAPTKTAKTTGPDLTEITAKSINPTKPPAPTEVHHEHEIIKSNVSLKEDIIQNPYDYETQTFGFDLKCSHDHFWRAGKAIPLSNGKPFCIRCGEQLKNANQKARPRYRRF